MTHIHDYIRNHILQHIDNEKMPSLETLEKTEWSNEFERFMRERYTELLVDIANLCLLEFIEGNHKDKHFESKDHNIHTQVKDSRCVNR